MMHRQGVSSAVVPPPRELKLWTGSALDHGGRAGLTVGAAGADPPKSTRMRATSLSTQ